MIHTLLSTHRKNTIHQIHNKMSMIPEGTYNELIASLDTQAAPLFPHHYRTLFKNGSLIPNWL